jgi:hypothetical protein
MMAKMPKKKKYEGTTRSLGLRLRQANKAPALPTMCTLAG